MKKHTIKEAAVIVLKKYNKPMSVEDICDKIIEYELYDFGARSPKSVLRIEMARAAENQNYSKPYAEKLFWLLNNNVYKLNQ